MLFTPVKLGYFDHQWQPEFPKLADHSSQSPVL